MTPTLKVTRVTPAMATKLLEANRQNRDIKQHQVNALADTMNRGEWDPENGAAIKIDINGDIQDGQHRLWAVIETGKPIRMCIIKGVSVDAYATIDQGLRRSVGDFLKHEGVTQYAIVAATIAVVARIEAGMPSSGWRLTPLQSREFIDNNPNILLSATFPESHKVVRSCKLLGSSKFGALHYLFGNRSSGEHPTEEIEAWLTKVATGVGIMDDMDPAHILRKRLMSNLTSTSLLPGKDIIALVIKAWNLHVTGEKRKFLTWRGDEDFPEIL